MLGRARELGHLVLYVSDLDRSLVFYRDILGWPIVTPARPHFRAAVFRAGNTHHDFLLIEVGKNAQPIPKGPHVGMYHFGVKVGDSDDDLRALLGRIQAHPDIVTLAGAVDSGFIRSLYVHDPDGFEVELYTDVPGWDWNDPRLFEVSRRPLRL
ncbi:glyoxalase [Streptomyces griseoruber]|uniref:Glyoxalase n=2 Tax=Streptomyces griseoruber TaxID=1943 RepID=A0A101T9G2_9ACTN|nr:glyoxalase [Streptomyces griseoruber]